MTDQHCNPLTVNITTSKPVGYSDQKLRIKE